MSRTVTEWVLKLVDDITSPMRSVHEACSGAGKAAEAAAESIDDIHETVSRMPGSAEKIGAAAFMFNQVTDAAGRMNSELKNAIAPGERFQYAMAEMSAITGQSGEGLEKLGDEAKGLAEKYGVNATGSVESFKLLLSQLSPDLADNSEALGSMTENVMVLSKTMGGDTTAAAEVLTTAMNQYGVSMDDPIAAAGEMSRMMNIMAAAAKEGSAELPAQKAALEQAGMAAKVANIGFAETTAAIQVLDKAGKKGSEGGVALRNVLSTLGQGRFLPKNVQEELAAAGVNINGLTDKSKSLSERLSLLKPVMQDDALLIKMFEKESQAAALALLNGTDQMDDWRVAIEGTNTAFDQAAIIMDTNIEEQKRMNSWIDNVKIGFFDAIAPVTPFITIMGDAVTGVSSFGFAIYGLSIVFKKDLWTGVWSGIKAVGTWMKTTASAALKSKVFATVSAVSFSTFKISAITACKAVGTAIKSIPIVGWIIAIIAALIALGTYFYNTSASFRGFLWGLWESIKAVFGGIGKFLGEVFGGIWHLIKGVFNPANWFDSDYKFSDGIDRITNAASEFGKEVGDAFSKGREEGIADFSEEKARKADEAAAENAANSGFKLVEPPEMEEEMVIAPIAGSTSGSIAVNGAENKPVNLAGDGGGTGGGGRNITMNVTFNQTFRVDGNGNIDGIAEQVMRVITGTMRDATVALS